MNIFPLSLSIEWISFQMKLKAPSTETYFTTKYEKRKEKTKKLSLSSVNKL